MVEGRLSIDPNQALKRMSISGLVTLQRKSYWVARFAQIKESIFTYRKDQKEMTPRYVVDLRQSQVSRGHRDNGEFFIQITGPDKTTVKVSFDNREKFQQWGLVFVESIKSDDELRRLQVLEPMQREQDEQKRLDDMQEAQSRKSKVISQRRAFKTSAKLLYVGKFLNFWREKAWEADKRKVALDLKNKWSTNTTWYLTEVKGGVQVLTTERGVDFSIKRIITEEYQQKIKENKVAPLEPLRDMAPLSVIIGVGLVGLAATVPELQALPVEAQAVAVGVVILMAISYEMHRSKNMAAYREAITKFNQGIDPNPLPKKFGLKLITDMEATPAEFADALLEDTKRAQWELKLKGIKKKDKATLQLEYVGVAAPHTVSYDLEVLPAEKGLTSYLVNEMTVMNQGLAKATTIYLLEEIAFRPGVLRVTQFGQVNSEDEARARMKRFSSLKVMLGMADRTGLPVGNLEEIQTKAQTIAIDGVEGISEEDDSFDDDGIQSVNGEIEQTEAGIEEAQNVAPAINVVQSQNKPQIEEMKDDTPAAPQENMVEDLTCPTSIMSVEEVTDWEDRMDRFDYSAQQRETLRQCHEKRDAWLQFCDQGPWEVNTENKKDQYTISLCTSSHGVPAMKSSGIFPFSLMQMFACIHDSRYRPLYDDNIEKAELLTKVACNTYMIYQKTKSMIVVSSRDFVLTHHVCPVQHPTLCPKGGVLILAFTPTPERDDIVPITKKAVRGHVYLAGWLLESISEHETRGTLLLECDLKGGLSNYVIKKALGMQGNQLKPLKGIITKYLKENPQCPYK